MLFSSMVFLWIFLPIVLFFYFIVKEEYKNILLLIASLIFYAWGEPIYILLMLASISINYILAIQMDKQREKTYKKLILIGSVLINLGLLFYFKYFNLFVSTINGICSDKKLAFKNIALPIGISFYTFQAMSYVIDLYREEIKVQKSWFKLALYISFFPQLIAGPIVKYKDIYKQIEKRICSVTGFTYGIKRFAYGMGKKVIISNTMAQVVDNILKIDSVYIGTGLSWCVAICYTLQIYFDFSGYSDMAIGLGKMFGFDISENFNYPYISQSIQEFWRRWHISLSTWFKEYLYIPLGGNKKGVYRTYINLFVVFLTTGLWHGASYTFLFWGIYHGLFLILERIFLSKVLKKNPVKILNHLYAMAVVIIGWVLFRCDTLQQGIELVKNMFIYKTDITYNMMYYLNFKVIIIMCIAIILAMYPLFFRKIFMLKVESAMEVSGMEMIFCIAILSYCIFLMICNTYNPFIYFRF